MDAAHALIKLKNGSADLGVRTTCNRQCFLISNDCIECDVSGNSDETIEFSAADFLDEFQSSHFRVIQTQDMAG